MELQIEHLCKTYRKKEALQDVSFTLHKGIYGLLGGKRCRKKHTYANAGNCGFSHEREYPLR